MDDENFMREAIKEAELALERGDHPIGAVIVFRSEIISRDGNRVHSSQRSAAHAELNALWKLPRDFVKKNIGRIYLYTTYEPCPMCFGAAVQYYIGKLVYGINWDKSGATHLYSDFPEFYSPSKRGKMEIKGGVLEKECNDVYIRSKYGLMD
jgi:tRNA(adenine34) deaminase